MKRIIFLTLLLVVTAVASAQQTQPTAPVVPDKAALAIRNEQLAQERMAARFTALQQEMKVIRGAFPASQERFSSAVEEAYKGVDKKLWVLDVDSMTFKPVPKPSPSP